MPTDISHRAECVPVRDWRARFAIVGSILLFVLLGTAIYVLQTPEVTIKITGAPTTELMGNVVVDGQTQLISGQVPVTLKYRGRHVGFNVLPVGRSDGELQVHLAGREATGAQGVCGWYDARRVIPNVMVRPLGDMEGQILARQLGNMSSAGTPPVDPAPERPDEPD
jgi:hypothetical protein